MAILTIDFNMNDPELSLAGLSFKKLQGKAAEQHMYRSDSGKYALESRFNIDGRTNRINESHLLKCLLEIKEEIPFDKVKIIGYYPLTGEEIINKLNTTK